MGFRPTSGNVEIRSVLSSQSQQTRPVDYISPSTRTLVVTIACPVRNPGVPGVPGVLGLPLLKPGVRGEPPSW